VRLCSFSQFAQFGKQSSNALTPLLVFRKFSWRVLRPSTLSKKLRLLVEKSPQFVAELGDSVASPRNIPFIRHDEYLKGAPKRPQSGKILISYAKRMKLSVVPLRLLRKMKRGIVRFLERYLETGRPPNPAALLRAAGTPHPAAKPDSSHLAYRIGLFVPQEWLNSPSSTALRCLKTYAIFVQIHRPATPRQNSLSGTSGFPVLHLNRPKIA
jgi:hypothetical protein